MAAPGCRHCSSRSGEVCAPASEGRLVSQPSATALYRLGIRRRPWNPCRRRWLATPWTAHAATLGAGARAGAGAAEVRHARRSIAPARECAGAPASTGDRPRSGGLIENRARRQSPSRPASRRRRPRSHPAHRARSAVAGDRLTVGDDVDVLASRLAFGERTAGAGHLPEHALEAMLTRSISFRSSPNTLIPTGVRTPVVNDVDARPDAGAMAS